MFSVKNLESILNFDNVVLDLRATTSTVKLEYSNVASAISWRFACLAIYRSSENEGKIHTREICIRIIVVHYLILGDYICRIDSKGLRRHYESSTISKFVWYISR
jgi:hypothetical protein